MTATLLAALLSMPTVSAQTVVATPSSYQVGPRDVLGVRVYLEPDLSQNYRVDEDGTIDFPLLGRTMVDGLSVSAVDDLLTRELGSRYLRNPQVDVQVVEFSSQTVEVLGAVRKPGSYPLSGPTTITQIIAAAGGTTDEASTRVRVQAPNGEGEGESFTLDDLLAGKGNRMVAAGETVFIPQAQYVYISGQVQKPGGVAYTEGLTVLQALTRAGGPLRTARLKEAYILREGVQIPVNLKRVLNGRDPDVTLLPDDQIYIKESVF